MFIPVPNTIQARLVYQADSQIMINALNFTGTAPPTQGDMATLGAALVGWWNTNLRPLVAAEITLAEIQLTSLESQSAPGQTYVTGLPLVGAAVSAVLPFNVTLSMAAITALRGRNYRGRIYHVGLTEGNVTANRATTTIVGQLVTAYNTLTTIPASSPFKVSVVSRFTGGDPRPFGISTPIIRFATDGIIDSQRRRLPSRGN